MTCNASSARSCTRPGPLVATTRCAHQLAHTTSSAVQVFWLLEAPSSRWSRALISTKAAEGQAVSPASQLDDEDDADSNFGLILPDARYQQALDKSTRNALKTRANTAAREKTLMYIQVGRCTIPMVAT